jgi:hypothetical protein
LGGKNSNEKRGSPLANRLLIRMVTDGDGRRRLTATESNSGYRTENGDYRAIFNPHGSAGHQGEWDKRPSNVRISAEVVGGRAGQHSPMYPEPYRQCLCALSSSFETDPLSARQRSRLPVWRHGWGVSDRLLD